MAKTKRVAAAGPVEGPWALPGGWRWESLGQLGTWTGGGTPSKGQPEFWTDGHIPWVSPKDMKRPLIDGTEDYITAAAVAGSSAKMVAPGAVLCVMRSGILRHTFPVAVNTVDVTLNQDMRALSPRSDILPRYLAYYLELTGGTVLETASKGGTTVNSIEAPRLGRHPVPVVRPDVQQRIVARIDELFAEIDDGEAALARARDDLATWRKALLKAAVTGELTADWRAERLKQDGPPTETGADLLARILADCRARWDAEPRNKGKKYKEPQAPSLDRLPILPNGWVWSSLGQLLDRIEAGLNVKCVERPPEDGETGLVKISAVTWWRFNELASKTLAEGHGHGEEWLINEGDLLVSRANTLELVAAPAIVGPLTKRLMLSDKVLRLVLARNLRRWVFYVMRSPFGRQQIEIRATGNQLSMRNISQDSLRALPIPLPSSVEIARLVTLLEEGTDQHECLEAASSQGLGDAATLRQSILAAAFRGDLA